MTLSIIMLSEGMLNVITLSVLAPNIKLASNGLGHLPETAATKGKNVF